MSDQFKLVSNYEPKGDQPKAIEKLVKQVEAGDNHLTLLGATGTGKTFTVSNVVEKINRPTLVIAHNKTLAGQLYSEFKEYFPDNAVEYFVSYYDYYQPEAYVPSTDTFIEKDASINDEIDNLRHLSSSLLYDRYDVINFTILSCIYVLVTLQQYNSHVLSFRYCLQKVTNQLLRVLVVIQYAQNYIDFKRFT